MATAKLYNMARMTTATTGTGTITLGSAVSGFISFATAGVTDGDVVTYAIEDSSNREIGRGTYTAAGTTLARTTVLKSTNAGAAISLSGSAQVFITNAAEDHIQGPASSTANAVVRYSGTGGATIQNSVVTVADTTGTLSTSGGGDLGVTSTAPWGNLFLKSGGVVNFNNSNVAINHDNTGHGLQFQGGNTNSTFWNFSNGALDTSRYGAIQITNEFVTGRRQQLAFVQNGTRVVSFGYEGTVATWGLGSGNATDASWTADILAYDFTGSQWKFGSDVVPLASGTQHLGSGSLMWSDLFLKSTGKLDWGNGNVTLTHAAGALTVAGATTVSLGTSAAFTTGTIELGAASDTTLSRSSAGVLAVEGVTVSLNSTSSVHTASTIELGNASDTTLSRASAGVLAIEGVSLYPNIPLLSKSAAYTVVLGDANTAIFHPSADTTARTFTIDSNANVAYPVGTTLTFINQASAGVLTIAITTDTMRLSSAGTTGSRTLAANGIATAVKVTSTEWLINGTGLT